jgi:hypothetical protein
MGHQRLGWLPQTHRWQDVVGLIASDGTATQVADATLLAAQRGLAGATRDAGVRHVVWLLAHVVMAARTGDFAVNLRELGVRVSAQPSTFDLVGAVADAVDEHLAGEADRTDFGEMAQMAAAESLATLIAGNTPTLFESPPRSVRDVVYDLSTQGGFRSLAHDFFQRLTRRFLEYHLSRELSCHVGGGRRFADVHTHGRFLEQLDFTCHQATLIVRDYAGDWYSKYKFEDGISRRAVGIFVETAFTKMRAELKRRGQGWQPEPEKKGDANAA